MIDGGTNRITNIVPICSVCHRIAHGSRTIHKRHKARITGRKRIEREGSKDIILNYLYGVYGMKECKSLLGLTKASKLVDCIQFKDLVDELGITSHKNKIDLYETKGWKCYDYDLIAYVTFKNGNLEGTLGNGERISTTVNYLRNLR